MSLRIELTIGSRRDWPRLAWEILVAWLRGKKTVTIRTTMQPSQISINGQRAGNPTPDVTVSEVPNAK